MTLEKGNKRFTVVTEFQRHYKYTQEIDAPDAEKAKEIALTLDADDPRVVADDYDTELEVTSCESYTCNLCGGDLGDVFEAGIVLPFGDVCGKCLDEMKIQHPDHATTEPKKLTLPEIEKIIDSDKAFSEYLDGSDSGPVLDLIQQAIEVTDEAVDEIEIIAVIDEILLMRKAYIARQ